MEFNIDYCKLWQIWKEFKIHVQKEKKDFFKWINANIERGL